MKLLRRGSLFFILIYFNFILHTICFESSGGGDSDPFKSLGIPDLNPKQLLEELDAANNKNNKKQEVPKLRSIEDLPNFLKNSKINEDEAIKVLTRFLIQDDITLKKYGVVYDQTGFDGINNHEKISPIGTEERLVQRARSAANIWFREKYSKLDYDAYGAEQLNDEIVPNWRLYKVLMIGKHGENTFIKVCLPLDESETALCSDQDEPCAQRAEYVEQEKKKNEDYIERIRTNNFFPKKKKLGAVKLLPGEKMIVKDKDKNVVLTSQNMNRMNDVFFNPPKLDAVKNHNPLVAAALKNKNPMIVNNSMPPMMGNMNGNNFAQFGMPTNQAQRNLFLNNNNQHFNNFNNNQPFQQGYNFKQMDNSSATNGNSSNTVNNSGNLRGTINNSLNMGDPNTHSNMMPNSQADLYKEIMDMKNQLAQMMESLKQKENTILQNNQKINSPQQTISNSNNNQGVNSNIMVNGQMDPQLFNNNGMNFNQMNNNQMAGFNPFLQSSSPNSFPQITNTINMIPNNFLNNQNGPNNNQLVPNKNPHSSTISNVL